MLKRSREFVLIVVSILAAMGVCAVNETSADSGSCRGHRTRNIVGEVYDIRESANRLYVVTDITREKWNFFVHTAVLHSLKKGDRVRVYFPCGQSLALSVQKMTPVAYKENGENRGYILKQ